MVLPVEPGCCRASAERIGAPRAIALGAVLSAAGCLALLPIAPGTQLLGHRTAARRDGRRTGTAGAAADRRHLLGSVEKSRSGIAAGVLNATRQTGSVLGVALFGSLIGQGDAFIAGTHAVARDLGRGAAASAPAAIWRGGAKADVERRGRQALRSAKLAPQNAITAPRQSAAIPASTPEMVEARARRGGGLAGAGEQQHADRDQELPHSLRNLPGDGAVHQRWR